MRTTSRFPMVLAGAGALLAAACSSSSSPSPADGGGGGGSSTNPFASMGVELVPTDTGFIQDMTSGVTGAWYAYGDSVGSNASPTDTDAADSNCIKAGHMASECSQITSPTPGQMFPPDPAKGMCTSGTAAKVLDIPGKTDPDYSNMWGAGIALDFNNPGAGAPKGVYDLSKYSGIAFVFTGDKVPPGKMRVNFPFVGEHGNDSPYYKGATLDNSMLQNGQMVVIHWSDVGGPAYLASQTPPVTAPPFDTTMAQSIQWQVFTNISNATPYSFCVNHLTLLNK